MMTHAYDLQTKTTHLCNTSSANSTYLVKILQQLLKRAL